MELTPIQQLDEVLKYLYEQTSNVDLDNLDKFFTMRGDKRIVTDDLKRIILKLIREQLCEWHPKGIDKDPAGGLYFISFEGKLLKENGGYEAKIKSDKAKEKVIDEQITSATSASNATTKLYDRTETYYKHQKNATWVIAVATIVNIVVALVPYITNTSEGKAQLQLLQKGQQELKRQTDSLQKNQILLEKKIKEVASRPLGS